jgi:hypothetical protein
VRAYLAEPDEAPASSTVVASIPVHAFDSGIVLAACERTYALRAELRAAGGVWRVVPTTAGSVLGWAFSTEEAQGAIDLITRTAECAALSGAAPASDP